MKLAPLILAAAGFLSACNSVQTSSGQAYVKARPGSIDKEIATIAAVEPRISFPAKIGLARVINGKLTQSTQTEIEAFAKIADRQRDLGSFVSISPFSAELAASRLPAKQQRSTSVLQTVRRAAAVQHVDYVLVYEVGASSSVYNTPFALADITIIGGAILPTRGVKVTGVGRGVFVDVRNGYPYATMQTQVDLSGLARSFGASNVESARLRSKAIEKVTIKLVPEFEQALLKLARR